MYLCNILITKRKKSIRNLLPGKGDILLKANAKKLTKKH